MSQKKWEQGGPEGQVTRSSNSTGKIEMFLRMYFVVESSTCLHVDRRLFAHSKGFGKGLTDVLLFLTATKKIEAQGNFINIIILEFQSMKKNEMNKNNNNNINIIIIIHIITITSHASKRSSKNMRNEVTIKGSEPNQKRTAGRASISVSILREVLGNHNLNKINNYSRFIKLPKKRVGENTIRVINIIMELCLDQCILIAIIMARPNNGNNPTAERIT
eukprot:gene7280-5124_t